MAVRFEVSGFDRAMNPPDRLRVLNDRALWPVIEGPDERARERAVEALVTDFVTPIVDPILRRFRRTEPNLHPADMEEISSLIALRLMQKVRAAAVHEEHAIQALEHYVTKLTYNALHDFRRHRYPERHRLKRNLRYILTRQPSFALWELDDDTVAGLSGWLGRSPSPGTNALTRFSATAAMRDRTQPIEALTAIFERIGHPVVFELLIDVAAELWDVRDVVLESGDFPPDERHDPLSSIEQRQYLEALWAEIRDLPDNQRTALLLNLRDSAGSNALTLFLLLNVAGVVEIASAAGVTVEELNDLWDRLPLEDFSIADRLRLTRQQVISLRKSARMRLARRMGKWR